MWGADLPALADGVCVQASRDGYVVEVREHVLMRLARGPDVVVRPFVRPGAFGVGRTPLASVSPQHRADVTVARNVGASIVLADSRDPRQDVEFATQQLVEMARALSPGTGDLSQPSTLSMTSPRA
jgi:uncharacterized membrane protein